MEGFVLAGGINAGARPHISDLDAFDAGAVVTKIY